MSESSSSTCSPLRAPRFLSSANELVKPRDNTVVSAEACGNLLAICEKPYYFRAMTKARVAKFPIGAVVKHRLFPFRGVVFDIDPVFANTEEWYEAIPAEVRPRKDQPFYHLFAENA